jgi:hypothetical protein
MELGHNGVLALLGAQVLAARRRAHAHEGVDPTELVLAAEHPGHDKITQTPQLNHVILHGGAREQHPVPAVNAHDAINAPTCSFLQEVSLNQHQGVPSHVSDTHTKELIHDVRQGMGLNEEYSRGQFKAIFVTGGPGSGKDVIIREAIASERATELNFTQVCDILNDKHKLAMKSMNPRNESVRNRGPLIINGPADDNERITHIKEELEELGYDTMMVFVGTNNETSQHRNSLLTRMMVESVRQDKWLKAQKNTKYFIESFTNFISFDNTGDLNTKEEDITDIYQKTKMFLDASVVSESALDWIHRNGSLRNKFNIIGEENVKSNSKFIQGKTVGKYNPFYRAARPSDIPADNRAGDPNADNIKWDGGKKRGSYIFRTYEEKSPTLKINSPPKEPNFQKDNEKEKRLKRGDKSGSTSRVGRPDGIGSTWSTRTNGTGLTGGAGLGNQTYSEDKQIISKIKSKRSTGGGQEYSNAAPSTTAFPAGQAIGNNFVGEKKDFKKFRESIDSPGEVAMGVGGTLMGATNKEPMETYADKNRMGILIDKKKKKKGAK